MSSDTVIASWRIERACSLIGRLISQNPIVPDAFADTEAVQAWAFVNSLYNGIEQALKHILIISDIGMTREELKRRPYGHDLEELFSRVAEDDRQHLAAHFREHRSLHNYNTDGQFTDSIEEFIAHINLVPGGSAAGLVKWRYALLDGIEAIPRTHLWSMWEVWDGICCLIRHQEYDKTDDCFRLSRRLLWLFEKPLGGMVIPYDEYIDDLNEWHSRSRSERLGDWIDLLVELDRQPVSACTVENSFRGVLLNVAARALRRLEIEREDPDQIQLIQRMRHGRDRLSWDRRNELFRATTNLE